MPVRFAVALARGWRIPLFLLVVVSTLWLAEAAYHNRFDEDLKDLLGERPGEYQAFSELVEVFGPDDDIFVAIPLELASIDHLEAVVRVRNRVASLPGVFSVTGVPDLLRVTSLEGVSRLREEPRRWDRLVGEIHDNPLASRRFLSRDQQKQLLVVKPSGTTASEKHSFVRALRVYLASEKIAGQARIAGYSVFTERYVHSLRRENGRFLVLGLIMAIFLSVLLFPGWREMLAALVSVGLPPVWTLGLFALGGNRLTLFSTLLAPVILIVGLGLALQVSVRLVRDPLGSGESGDGMEKALTDVFRPGLICALTTIVGFGSQVASNVAGIRAFGWFASLGCGLSFLSVSLLLPALWLQLGCSGVSTRCEPSEETNGIRVGPGKKRRTMVQRVNRWAASISISPAWVVAIVISFMVLSVSGMNRLRLGGDPMSALPDSDDVVQDQRFMEDEFGLPPRWISISCRFRDGAGDSAKVMLAFERLQKLLEEDPDVAVVLTPAQVVEQAWSGVVGSVWPQNPSDLDVERGLRIAEAHLPGVLKGFINAPFYDRARLAVGLKTSDPERVISASARFASAAALISPEISHFRPTGRMLLSAFVEHDAIVMQTASFGGTLVAILVIIGFAFRSWRATLVATAANLLPIGVAMGIVGWSGHPLDSATAMAPCICLGIIVDDTIHLSHAFSRAIKRYGDPLLARRAVMLRLGWATVAASLILLSGLGMLIFSDFSPVRRFGACSALTVAVGLMFELLLTPALLGWGVYNKNVEPPNIEPE